MGTFHKDIHAVSDHNGTIVEVCDCFDVSYIQMSQSRQKKWLKNLKKNGVHMGDHRVSCITLTLNSIDRNSTVWPDGIKWSFLISTLLLSLIQDYRDEK